MFCDGAKGRGLYNRMARGCYLRIHHDVPCAIPTVGQAAVVRSGSPAAHTDLMGASTIKCWQNDTKTLQCIKLQPWSFKRAEFWHRTGCLRCLLLVMCTHPFAKKGLTLHLARSEGREPYLGGNLMHRKVLASSHQHLMAEAPVYFKRAEFWHRTGSGTAGPLRR